jgi:hypothetical protein
MPKRFRFLAERPFLTLGASPYLICRIFPPYTPRIPTLSVACSRLIHRVSLPYLLHIPALYTAYPYLICCIFLPYKPRIPALSAAYSRLIRRVFLALYAAHSYPLRRQPLAHRPLEEMGTWHNQKPSSTFMQEYVIGLESLENGKPCSRRRPRRRGFVVSSAERTAARAIYCESKAIKNFRMSVAFKAAGEHPSSGRHP